MEIDFPDSRTKIVEVKERKWVKWNWIGHIVKMTDER